MNKIDTKDSLVGDLALIPAMPSSGSAFGVRFALSDVHWRTATVTVDANAVSTQSRCFMRTPVILFPYGGRIVALDFDNMAVLYGDQGYMPANIPVDDWRSFLGNFHASYFVRTGNGFHFVGLSNYDGFEVPQEIARFVDKAYLECSKSREFWALRVGASPKLDRSTNDLEPLINPADIVEPSMAAYGFDKIYQYHAELIAVFQDTRVAMVLRK